ncbi:hypothetical protein GIS00_02160 [Nakamurella sp. YIM 132087]|uniref:Uncharacterized protein n=1 Tax=Nakamurella alba TaxID=2665158 RepID=A0A7K1FF75_9ACTN|nr:hypothetical protein [Nakamurella alba]
MPPATPAGTASGVLANRRRTYTRFAAYWKIATPTRDPMTGPAAPSGPVSQYDSRMLTGAISRIM